MSLVLDLLFPPRCPFCRRAVEEDGTLCADCQASLPWRLGRRAHRRVELLEDCAGALDYRGPVRGCIHRFKFYRKRGYARLLGTLTAQCARDHFPQAFDVVSWPPLSPRGLRRRGFDQAQLLAQAVALDRGMDATGLFQKRNAARQQSRLRDPAARRANALGAYTLVAPQAVRGKTVLLVDDVVTTGATLSECARLLLLAGARGVWAVTLAAAGGGTGAEGPIPARAGEKF